MSSFNIDDASGDKVRNLSVQWNYAASSSVSNRRASHRERELESLRIPQTVKTFLNAACMIAGAATTVAAISFATGWIRIEDLQRLAQF